MNLVSDCQERVHTTRWKILETLCQKCRGVGFCYRIIHIVTETVKLSQHNRTANCSQNIKINTTKYHIF